MISFIRRILILCIIILVNTFFLSTNFTSDIKASLAVTIHSDCDRNIQLFSSKTGNFTENESQTIEYKHSAQKQEIIFNIPVTTQFIRLDFGTESGKIKIEKLDIQYKSNIINLLAQLETLLLSQNMIESTFKEEHAELACTGNDPYIICDISSFELNDLLREYAETNNFYNKMFLCIVFDIIVALGFSFRKQIIFFIRDIIGNKGLLLDLAQNDFKTKYAGSYLGIVWAFVQPIVTILVYWFVFQVGFRSGVIDDTPFVLWLTAGLVPWFFFNESLNSATASLLDYSYLVKKVVFNVEIIPLVRIMSSLFVHLFFCVFVMFLFVLNGIYPCLEWLQIIYYSTCLILLIIGITYMTSSLVIFFRDLSQIIMVILQIGMWITPIMWNKEMISGKLQLVFKLNPLYYIVQGYRDSLIYHKWFWEREYETAYFWIITVICIAIGNKIFNKLKIHFADVI